MGFARWIRTRNMGRADGQASHPWANPSSSLGSDRPLIGRHVSQTRRRPQCSIDGRTGGEIDSAGHRPKCQLPRCPGSPGSSAAMGPIFEIEDAAEGR